MRLARSLSIASWLVDALLVTLVALVLACLAVRGLGPGLGHPVLVIRGGSMQPAIPLGSLVILDRGVPSDLRVGDVVAFPAPNSTIVTHRVARLVSIGATPYFGTKGDANSQADPVITPVSAIIGRVSWTLPGVGYLVTLLSVPIGIAAVFLIGATLLGTALLLEELAVDRRERTRRIGRPSPTRPLAAPSPARPTPPGD